MMMKIDTQLGFYKSDFVPPRWNKQWREWEKSEETWLAERRKVKWKDFMKSDASVLTVLSALFVVYIAISLLLLLWFGILLLHP